jgi:hypothetical protein
MRARERPGMPSIWQGPSPRDALSDARLGTSLDSRLGHRDSRSRRLVRPRGLLRVFRRPGPRPRAPLPTGDTLLWTQASLADFCNLIRRAGTPYERSTLAREWSFRPATRRHQPMPVALARRCVAASMACEPRSVHSDLRAPCSTCVDGTDCGPRRSSKGDRAFLDEFARALLVTPRAPGSPARLGRRSGGPRPSSVRPRSPSDASPRRETPSKRPGCLLPYWNPYVTGGWLLRARLDRGPFTPPPWRHCSGTVAPFSPPRVRLPSDEESTRKRIDRSNQGGPKPL